MFYDLIVEMTECKVKQIFVEADNREDAVNKVQQIAKENGNNWDWDGSVSSSFSVNNKEIHEFSSLDDAHGYYASGNEIPAYRVKDGIVEEIKGSTEISNEIIDDGDISFNATGILAYLLSKPDGWVFSIDRIAEAKGDVRSSIQAGIDELEEKGYLLRVLDENGYSYIVNDIARKETDMPTAPLYKKRRSGR